MSIPSKPKSLIIRTIDAMNVSFSMLLSSETGAVAPPMLINTFLPCACKVCIPEIKADGETWSGTTSILKSFPCSGPEMILQQHYSGNRFDPPGYKVNLHPASFENIRPMQEPEAVQK